MNMSYYRRPSAPGLGVKTRRRSSANYAAASGRRCSLSTFAATSRSRSSSKGHVIVGEEDIELCQPLLEEMPQVPGYENVTFELSTVPPPNIPAIIETQPQEEGNIKPFAEVAHLSGRDVRDILIRYADSKCRFDKNAARDMKIMSIEYQPGYKYSLETFTEARQVAWSYEPYTGGPLDEVDASVLPPAAWSVECSPPQPFQIHSVIMDVPHTDFLTTCHACGGIGSKRCNACSAAGWERCSFCLGDGHKISLQGQRERCFRCIGTGRKKCWKCGGDTVAVCRGCSGTGQIRCFISVTVTWSNHSDSHVIEPPEAAAIGPKLELANGHIVFEDEGPTVSPVVYPDEDLQSASSFLIKKHKDLASNEKLILQRHRVCAIPVYCVTYEWKQNNRRVFIYGLKKEIFAPNYPEQICCCIVS